MRIRFSLGTLLFFLSVISLLLGSVICAYNYIERERWRVHPSEQLTAEYITYTLGGSYTPEHRKKDKRIIGVNLQGTNATDADLAKLIHLAELRFLDIRNTLVSDASIEAILSHDKLIELKQKGSAITQDALKAAWYESPMRLSVDWD